MKVCKGCQEAKPLEDFYPLKTVRDGRRARCKSCDNDSYKKYYEDNAEYLRDCSSQYYRKNQTERNAKNKQWWVEFNTWIDELKSHPCKDCRKIYPPCVMQFDHRLPHEKSFTISQASNKKAILAEIQKCDLVCANCHALRTQLRHDVRKSIIALVAAFESTAMGGQ